MPPSALQMLLTIICLEKLPSPPFLSLLPSLFPCSSFQYFSLSSLFFLSCLSDILHAFTL